MWTAQTYLGMVVRDARYYMYLLVEDYVDAQKLFHEAVVENLRLLGFRTGTKSAIFAPDAVAKEHIKMELHGVFSEAMIRKLWGKTPGILFTDRNLSEVDPIDNRWLFLSLRPYMEERSPSALTTLFSDLERMIVGSADVISLLGNRRVSLLEWLREKVMIEPNFYGIGLKPMNRTALRDVIVTNRV